MKLLITLSLLIVSTSLFASPTKCVARLTNDYNQDSVAYSLNVDELEPKFQKDYGPDHLAQGILMVRALVSEAGCARGDINFGKGPGGKSSSKCRKLINYIDTSLVCYIESNLGFFSVSWDSFTNVHLVFNRWD
jgi:hypothetical protein